jgi:EAL domain-containing protein (putative c-di-GMP-specific phosphodiesterase class I)
MTEGAGERDFRFAMTCLGTGGWSCAELERLPLAYLKIPGDAIRGVANDPLGRAYVKVLNDTARHLGIESVAAQVDAADTLKALRAIGVRSGQGSYFSRPGPDPQW